MPKIPLQLPNMVPASFNVRGDHPRPRAKGSMIAELGAAGIGVLGELQFRMAQDRQRRDYNEAIISGQRAINTRLQEALLSNDPRSMLENYDRDLETDLSEIRQKLTNPNDAQEFDFRVNPGRDSARNKVMATQLQYERDESAAQLNLQLVELTKMALLNPTPETLKYVRDSIDGMTAEEVETGSKTPSQAKAFNQSAILALESAVAEDMLKAGKHAELRAMLNNGDFASIPPDAARVLQSKILADEQNQNYSDKFDSIAFGGADFGTARELQAMKDANPPQLRQDQYEKLLAMAQRDNGKRLIEQARKDRIEMAWNGQGTVFLNPNNRDDQKDVELFIRDEIDPLHMRTAGSMKDLWTMRMDTLARLGMGSESWQEDAFRIVANIQKDPDAAVYAARYLYEMNAIKPGIYQTNAFGSRAEQIQRLANMNIPGQEIAQLITNREFLLERTDTTASETQWQQVMDNNPAFVAQALWNKLDEDRRQRPSLGGKSFRQWIAAYGDRIVDGERQAARSIFDRIGSFLTGGLDIADVTPDWVPLFGDPVGTPDELDLGDLIFLDSKEPTATETPGITDSRMGFEDRGFWDNAANMFGSHIASVQFPQKMIDDITELAKYLNLEFNDPNAAVWAAAETLIGPVWDLTRYHGAARWDRNTVEMNEEPINGSHEWTRHQLEAEMNERFENWNKPLETLSGLAPRWHGPNELPGYLANLMRLFAFQATDDPSHPFTDKSLPEKSWEVARRTLNSIMQFGDIRKFPFDIYYGLAGPDPPNIVAFTTNETNIKTKQMSDGSWRDVQIYYLGIQDTSGAVIPLWEAIPGMDGTQREFWYDHTKAPEWGQAEHDRRQQDADLIVRNAVRRNMKLDQETDVNQLKQILGAAGFDDAMIERGLGIHSRAELFDMLGTVTGQVMPDRPRVPLGQTSLDRGVTGSPSTYLQLPEPLWHGKIPDYDHQAFLERQEEKKQAPVRKLEALRRQRIQSRVQIGGDSPADQGRVSPIDREE